MENERLRKQIESGALAQPVDEEFMKGLTQQGKCWILQSANWLVSNVINNAFRTTPFYCSTFLLLLSWILTLQLSVRSQTNSLTVILTKFAFSSTHLLEYIYLNL